MVDGNLKSNEKKLLFWWVIMLLIILIIITTITGCNNGWSVGNLDISPSDSIHIDYLIITDQDSSQHWYVSNTINNGITVGENYCYRHNVWEDVRKKKGE